MVCNPRAAALATLAVVALSWLGCNSRPRVADGEAIRLLGALRTACSSEDPQRLERVVAAIEEHRARGGLADGPYAEFQEIVALARAGEWDDAELECVAFQKAQTN